MSRSQTISDTAFAVFIVIVVALGLTARIAYGPATAQQCGAIETRLDARTPSLEPPSPMPYAPRSRFPLPAAH